ncbi:MAG: helix-turn-helix domain-containing protein [Gammaproteobacteria bacterium]
MDTQTLHNATHADDLIPASKPGARLRQLRQNLGLTEDEVAIQLHLSRGTLVAIEADAYEKLPGTTFVRGYLRAYAKLLHVSPDEVVEAFNVLYPDTNLVKNVSENQNYNHAVIKNKRQTESSVKWIGYAIFVIMVILVLIWWHNHSSNADDSSQTNTTAFQTPTTDAGTTAAAKSTPSSTTYSATTSTPVNATAIPAIGPGDDTNNQMTMTNPIAATVATSAANVPGMQPDTTLSPSMAANASKKTIDVTQTTANAAAVPGISPVPPVVTSTTDTTNMSGAGKSKKGGGKSAWVNPDAN